MKIFESSVDQGDKKDKKESKSSKKKDKKSKKEASALWFRSPSPQPISAREGAPDDPRAASIGDCVCSCRGS